MSNMHIENEEGKETLRFFLSAGVCRGMGLLALFTFAFRCGVFLVEAVAAEDDLFLVDAAVQKIGKELRGKTSR